VAITGFNPKIAKFTQPKWCFLKTLKIISPEDIENTFSIDKVINIYKEGSGCLILKGG